MWCFPVSHGLCWVFCSSLLAAAGLRPIGHVQVLWMLSMLLALCDHAAVVGCGYDSNGLLLDICCHEAIPGVSLTCVDTNFLFINRHSLPMPSNQIFLCSSWFLFCWNKLAFPAERVAGFHDVKQCKILPQYPTIQKVLCTALQPLMRMPVAAEHF